MEDPKNNFAWVAPLCRMIAMIAAIYMVCQSVKYVTCIQRSDARYCSVFK